MNEQRFGGCAEPSAAAERNRPFGKEAKCSKGAEGQGKETIILQERLNDGGGRQGF